MSGTIARQLLICNSNKSLLISLPPEILKLISFYLTSPLDLLRFSHTCHDLFVLVAPGDWYSLAIYTHINWLVSCGGAKERDWMTIVLKDAALAGRLGYSLPPIPKQITPDGDVTGFEPHHSRQATIPYCQPSSLDEFDHRRPFRVQLSEAQSFETDPETIAAAGSKWVCMGSPIYNIDRDSHTVIAASMITRPTSAPSDSNGGDPRHHDHEILLYNLPDLTNPIARCGSDVWEKDKKTGTLSQPWYHPFTRDMLQVAQVVGIKHYPDDTVGGMRVVVVVALGPRAPSHNDTDSHILTAWSMLKVIEVRIPMIPMSRLSSVMINYFRTSPGLEPKVARACVRINPDSVVKYESIEPRQHLIMMHGYAVKLYSALEPTQHIMDTIGGVQESATMVANMPRRKVDCIAVFGIQKSDAASAMVIKKVIFSGDENSGLNLDLGRQTYSNKAVSRGVSCMALFPEHSGYEHLLVLFNQHGRGMVWDWINEKQIVQLHMPTDKYNKKVGQSTNAAVATASSLIDDAGVGMAAAYRRRMYYWGVHVSLALDVSSPDNKSNNGPFRIVAMADGPGDEWESCWWNITIDKLHEPMSALTAPPIIDRAKPWLSSSANNPHRAPLISSGKRFEHRTYGCVPEQEKTYIEEHNKPIQFIAYVIWNHYMIGLSSRMGICMVNLEEPPSGVVSDRQWITFLKNREDLIDIAIFGHNLIVTLKTGYLVWSFYGQESGTK